MTDHERQEGTSPDEKEAAERRASSSDESPSNVTRSTHDLTIGGSEKDAEPQNSLSNAEQAVEEPGACARRAARSRPARRRIAPRRLTCTRLKDALPAPPLSASSCARPLTLRRSRICSLELSPGTKLRSGTGPCAFTALATRLTHGFKPFLPSCADLRRAHLRSNLVGSQRSAGRHPGSAPRRPQRCRRPAPTQMARGTP